MSVTPKMSLTYWNKLHILSEQFNNNDHSNCRIDVITVDGPCACSKTTICAEKINNYLSKMPIDTDNLSALGYFYTANNICQKFSDNVWDRYPGNNLMWSVIWLCIDKARDLLKKRQVVENITDIDYDALLADWNNIFNSSIRKDLYDNFMDKYNQFIILVVDSNEQAIISRMRLRNEGSDMERSSWFAYCTVQNWFYAKFHLMFPERTYLVDISSFETLTDAQLFIKNKILTLKPNANFFKKRDCDEIKKYINSTLPPLVKYMSPDQVAETSREYIEQIKQDNLEIEVQRKKRKYSAIFIADS